MNTTNFAVNQLVATRSAIAELMFDSPYLTGKA